MLWEPVMAKESAEVTRQRILQQCLPLFADAGFDRVSMRQVAAATELTTAALYYHFPDKEQLFLAVVEDCFSQRVVPLLPDPQTSEPDPWLRLEAFISAFVALLVNVPSFQRLMQWLALDRDETRAHQMTERLFEPFFRSVADLLPVTLSDEERHMLTVSVMGLMVFPFETQVARQWLPGYQPPAEATAQLVKHILKLLKAGVM